MNSADCTICIDFVVPAGIDDILGPVYKLCPSCRPACYLCDGDGLFPAHRSFPRLIEQMLDLGRVAILCENCRGVLDTVEAGGWPEVTDHDH